MAYKLSPSESGVPLHNVVLLPYDQSWPETANRESEKLFLALDENLLRVEHFGSTAVAGMYAKPVVDLMPLVASLSLLDQRRRNIEAMGYSWHGEFGIPGRRFCTLENAEGIRLVHLHFYQADADQVLRHIAFRDYLIAHPDIAAVYVTEKKRAAVLFPHDSLAYNDEKAEWVAAHEKLALAWYAQQHAG